jgi:molecular chaperone DnaK
MSAAGQRKVLGIDLGTSNSVCSVVVGGRAIVIRDGDDRLVPSMVTTDPSGGLAVGQEARARRNERPEEVIYSAKRLLGRRFDSPEVRKMAKLVPYRIVAGEHESVDVEIGGRRLSVVEVQAEILRHLKRSAERALGESIDAAVVAVPANYTEVQRAATKLAAQRAGLDVLRMINEPTAAALAYGYVGDKEGRIAIFDLGGGTFDVTILEIDSQVYRVLSTAGDMFLGGDDLDAMLVDEMASWLLRERGADVRKNPRIMSFLREAAERAKIELSEADAVEIDLSWPCGLPAGSAPFRLDRRHFESVVKPVLSRTRQVCEDALRWAGIEPSDIDDVVMVGGSTNTPLVRNLVREIFGRVPNTDLNPTTAVAIGAAVQAAALAPGGLADDPKPLGSWARRVLLDVSPHSLGVRTVGGQVDVLIEKNSSIPVERTRQFTTTHDYQTSARIEICEGEARRFDDNHKLGSLELTNLPQAVRGTCTIDVTFEVDANGLLTVRAVDAATGRQAEANIRLLGLEAA